MAQAHRGSLTRRPDLHRLLDIDIVPMLQEVPPESNIGAGVNDDRAVAEQQLLEARCPSVARKVQQVLAAALLRRGQVLRAAPCPPLLHDFHVQCLAVMHLRLDPNFVMAMSANLQSSSAARA